MAGMLSCRVGGTPTPFGVPIVVVALAALNFNAAGGAEPEDPDVVVVVAASNPLETLTDSELADLFLGRTNSFPDGRPAIPIDQREGTPARAVFYVNFLGRSAAQMKAHWSKIVFTGRGSPPRETPGGVEARQLIAGDPRAIGYLERELVDASVQTVDLE
jgi:ABC-type phosphate transport system substrate-binding protein